MEKGLKMLGMGCILLVIIFIGFGCDMPWNKSTENTTTQTAGTSTGGTTGGTQYTANGIYNYNSGTRIFTLNTTASNFPVNNGPAIGTQTFTVVENSLTATQMIWSTPNEWGTTNVVESWMIWTRTSGTAGDVKGIWNGTGGQSGKNTYVMTLNADGSWSMVGFVYAVTSITDTTNTNTTDTSTTATSNFSGDWDGTFQGTWTDSPKYPLRSGIVHVTNSQINGTVTATGWSQNNPTAEDPAPQKVPFTRTGGKVIGNAFISAWTGSGTDSGGNTWTMYSTERGIINGNVYTGNADVTVITDSATFHIKQTLSLTKQ